MEVFFGDSLQWIMNLILAGLGTALTAMVGSFLKGTNFEKYIPMVDEVIHDGIQLTKQWFKNDIAKDSSIKFSNQFIGEVVKFVEDNAPKALKKAGFTREMVRKKVEAWLAEEENNNNKKSK